MTGAPLGVPRRRLRTAPKRVVIAGGGVAALETLLALRALAGNSFELTLLSPQRDFVYRPVTVAEPFGRGEARSFSLTEIVAARGGGRIVWASLATVEPDQHVAVTSDGSRIDYDALVVATGAIARAPFSGGVTFRGRDDVDGIRAVLDRLVSGRSRSLAFALPSERTWPLPLYELALMSAAHLRQLAGEPVRISLVTPEETPLALFGADIADAVSSLLESRGIELVTSSLPVRIDGRELALAGSGTVFADEIVTLPLLSGRRLPGLPHDRDGFIPVDAHGRVSDAADVYAAGDVTSFPLKQGGLAAQQADAVAEQIAAAAGLPIKPRPFSPVVRGLLLTGGAPLYLRCEPQRLPRPATVAIEARPSGRARPGVSEAAGQPLWWPPAKIAGRYLAPFLATARPAPLSADLLLDRAPVPGAAVPEQEFEDAVELALLLADCDARWGDYSSALTALDSAEALNGVLPTEYEHKRREWQAAAHAA